MSQVYIVVLMFSKCRGNTNSVFFPDLEVELQQANVSEPWPV